MSLKKFKIIIQNIYLKLKDKKTRQALISSIIPSNRDKFFNDCRTIAIVLVIFIIYVFLVFIAALPSFLAEQYCLGYSLNPENWNWDIFINQLKEQHTPFSFFWAVLKSSDIAYLIRKILGI